MKITTCPRRLHAPLAPAATRTGQDLELPADAQGHPIPFELDSGHPEPLEVEKLVE